MRKVQLSLDDLAVESFATIERSAKQHGTVKGRMETVREHTCDTLNHHCAGYTTKIDPDLGTCGFSECQGGSCRTCDACETIDTCDY